MTQQPIGQAPAPEAPRLTFGPGPTQELSHLLAQAVLWEVWKSNPQQFGNYVKKAMIALWGPNASSANGRHSG